MAELGRSLSLAGRVAAKHCIKRVDRFIGNRRVESLEAMRGVVQWLARPRKRLLVSLDWVSVRSFQCLVLAARLRGRAVPLLWTVHRDEYLYRSRNNLEYGLLRLFRTMVPRSTEVVVLADRGFGRAEMAKECQKLGFNYIIRIEPRVYIRHDDFVGNLMDLPVKPGCRLMLREALYRKSRPIRQNVAVYWARGQKEPWFLMTNMTRLQPAGLTKVYGRRMTIEQYFRDTKSKRNGFGLRLTLVKSSDRLSRLLLVLALAYLFLVAVGLYATKHFAPKCWCSNNREGECSLFTIGRIMLDRSPPRRLQPLLNALRRETLDQNWG